MGEGAKGTAESIFPPLFENIIESNVLYSFIVSCSTTTKMSTIASLGVKEEVKNILDSGGFLRDVQEYLRSKFPHKRYGISKRSARRYCQVNGLRRYSSKKLNKTAVENVIKKASREVKVQSLSNFN